VEPYAGSAAVLLAKPRSGTEILNDVDGGVVHFFAVLRDWPAELARACRLTPYSRAEYGAAADFDDPGLPEVERACRFWVRCCQSFNCAGAGRRAGWAISSAPGSNEARSVAGIAARLDQVARRLSGVYIKRQDALDVIAAHGRPDALIYADPPHLAGTGSGFARTRAGDYRHEAAWEHHQALARALHATPAAVLLSGYDSRLYRDLYTGWHRLEIRVTKPSGNHGVTAARHATEVIWSSRPLAGDLVLFPRPDPAQPNDGPRDPAPTAAAREVMRALPASRLSAYQADARQECDGDTLPELRRLRVFGIANGVREATYDYERDDVASRPVSEVAHAAVR